MSNEEEFLLKWNNHQSNLIGVFKDWLQDESFVDVTLVCGGEAVYGHKVVLAACSPLLSRILHDNPCRHPVVILNDVCSTDMKALLKFIYQGEVSVSQSELASFLKTADNLQIKGLADGKEEEKKRKDDVASVGMRKKRKVETKLGNLNPPQSPIQRKKDESISSSQNCQIQNSCILTSSINPNELTSGVTFSNILNQQVENNKLLQPDCNNSSNLQKESMLIVKTEPLDYAGEMVWQESNANILLKPEIGSNINKISASNNNNSNSNVNSNCNSAQNSEMHSTTLPFVVIHPSLESIDSATTADILQKNLELVLAGEEKRTEEEIKNVSLGSEDLNQPTLNTDQSAGNEAFDVNGGNDQGGFKDLVEEDSSNLVIIKEEDGEPVVKEEDAITKEEYIFSSNEEQTINFNNNDIVRERRLPLSKTSTFRNSATEVTPFAMECSSSAAYYNMNGMLLCCRHCPYQSRNPYTFNRHLRIHFGEKDFKCNHCNYATNRKDSLMRHTRVKH